MRHRMGNSPYCNECRYWEEKKPNDHCRYDGWCLNTKARGINGKRPEHPAERVPVRWNWGTGCSHWIDAECGATHYEVCTGHVEEWREGLDAMYIAEQLKEGRRDRTS